MTFDYKPDNVHSLRQKAVRRMLFPVINISKNNSDRPNEIDVMSFLKSTKCHKSKFDTTMRFLPIIAIFFVLNFVFPYDSFGVPAAPDMFDLTQPDGKTFKARKWGDENFNGFETGNGYTIIHARQTKQWVYAEHDNSGRLKPSDRIVGAHYPGKGPFQVRPVNNARSRPFKRLTKEDILFPGNYDLHSEKPLPHKSRPSHVAPSRDLGKLPVVLVNFKNTKTTYNVNNFTRLLFGEGNYSMRDYYKEVSYGTFEVSGKVLGWYTARHGHDYYGKNVEIEHDGETDEGDAFPGTLVREAVAALESDKPDFDWSDYDLDGDCYVDVIAIVHQGAGEEASPLSTNLWSHRWSLNSAYGYGTSDGGEFTTHTVCPADPSFYIRVNDYIMLPETYKKGLATVGPFAHEYGHALGLPDLYDTDNSSYGVGIWSLMAGGSWASVSIHGDRPVHLDPWSKFSLRWVNPVKVDGVLYNKTIRAASDGPDVFQLLDGGFLSGEYFLIENRQKTGFDSGLPGEGILIWHIDASEMDNDHECYYYSCDNGHYKVALVQADNYRDLEEKSNRGDAGDPFPGTKNNTSFTASSSPDSRLYSGITSNVSVTDIGSSGTDMKATMSAPSIYSTPLGEALDNMESAWRTGGGAGWSGQNIFTYYGGSAAQSGAISDGQTSWIQTAIKGPGLLSYYWKVSSEYSNRLKFYIDDEEQGAINGKVDWQQKSYMISQGSHILRWNYEKDSSYSSGSDAGWLDKVEYKSSASCMYSINPTNSSVSAAGGTINVSVAAGSECVWTSASDADWITAGPDSGGSGNGTVAYTVGANNNTLSRTGTLTIAGQSFTVTQEGIVIVSLQEALDDNNLTWEMGGDAGWYGQNAFTYYGGTAAQSGAISDGQTSGIQAAVTGPGTLSFYWKGSSEYSDRLKFYIDDAEQGGISGNADWQQNTYIITHGSHVIRWKYGKDSSSSNGSDAGWLDKVEYKSSASCAYSLNPTGNTVDVFGGTRNVSVNADSECVWTAASDADWIKIISNSSGSGKGTVVYTVGSNNSTISRTGTLTVAGQSFTVAQDGIVVVPLQEALDNAGMIWETGGAADWYGQGGFAYNGDSAARSGAISDGQSSWIQTIVTGPGTVSFYWKVSSEYSDRLKFYADDVEQGTISGNVDWQQETYIIPPGGHLLKWSYGKDSSVQSGSDSGWIDRVVYDSPFACIHSVAPTVRFIGASGGFGNVSLSAENGCAWTAVSDVNWITVNSGSNGNGSGTASYTVRTNNGAGSRTGTLTIAGQKITVTQAGANASELDKALDNSGLIWITGGDAEWNIDNRVYYYGGSAAQSGAISDRQNSWIQATVTGPGILSFYWKVSSEYSDRLNFYIDDAEQDGISGNADWQQNTYIITDGSHVIRWKYGKDSSYSNGSDAVWLDKVAYVESVISCSYSVNPAEISISESSSTGSATVSTDNGCVWTAKSNESWISVYSSDNRGKGNGSLSYYISSNNDTKPRTGTLTVAGQIITVVQAGVPSYTITTSVPGGNGTILCSTPVKQGDRSTCRITPSSGYNLAALVDNGNDVMSLVSGTSYITSYVDKNHAITAVFSPAHSLVVNKAGTGDGTISGAGIHWQGLNVMVTAMASESSTFTGWNGDCSGADSTISIMMDVDKTCTAAFTLKTYSITSTAGTNGSIACSPDTVKYNSQGVCTILPDNGYHIADITDNGISRTDMVLGNIYEIGSVKEDHVINISFVKNEIARLPRTGQIKCYNDAGTEIACSGTGQDGEIQAGVALPDPRVTIGAGTEADCARDDLTGLMWARNARLAVKTWEKALDYIADLNSGEGLCGHKDWRLPNISELESLVEVSAYGPALPSAHPFTLQNMHSYWHWSSTTFAGDTQTAWLADIWTGLVDIGNKDEHYNVWPVRSAQGGQDSQAVLLTKTGQTESYDSERNGEDGDIESGAAWPNPRFMDHGNGTTTDELAGLMWLNDANCIKTNYPLFDDEDTAANGSVTWQEALDFISGINSGTYADCGAGHTDWRLPNRKELLSLIDRSKYSPSLQSTAPFTNVQLFGYWSSTTFEGNTGQAWSVNMNNGRMDGYDKSGRYYVWPVRSGQPAASGNLVVLTIIKSGTGSGALTPDSGSISCMSSQCSGTFSKGITLTVTASPSAKSLFAGWSGCDNAEGNACSITMDDNVTAHAVFNSSCAYNLKTVNKFFSHQGGTGRVKVRAISGCILSAVSNVDWITIKSAEHDTVIYTVKSNISKQSREGTLTIGNRTFTVTQEGAPCKFSIKPASASFDKYEAGGNIFAVTATEGCAWTTSVTKGPDWINLTSGASGTGSGTVAYSLAENTTKKIRTGKIKIEMGPVKKTLDIKQSK